VVEIRRVETKAEWRDFHRLPYAVYAGDPHWVPPLLLERRLHVSEKHNPYFAHAEAAYWVAYAGGRPVGRISAQIDQLHLAHHRDATGHFGFLEAMDDPAVFAALLRTAETWLRDRGMTQAVGPVSLSLWHEAGLLIEGFDTPPSVMMGHARPYFAGHLEAAGYVPAEDLIAYTNDAAAPIPPLAARIIERARKRGEVKIRPLDRARFSEEVALILDIVNDAWAENWGFVPMTAAEAKDFARILRLLLRPRDVAIAEHDGRPAGFAIVFPNLNEAIHDLGGRLAPFGWARLLWRLKLAGLKSVRVPLLGVRREFQNSPLGAALALSVIKAAADYNYGRGVVRSEQSWILARNQRMRHIAELYGARPYKRYRLYKRPL
jgi:GNAT superfamily N-acetyltransferase